MSLRVDLIYDSERRSGSPVTLKSLLRLLSVGVPLVLLGIVGIAFLNMVRLRAEADILEKQWEGIRPQKEQAEAIRNELLTNTRVVDELEQWRNARIGWYGQLVGLMQHTPRTIQLQRLQLLYNMELLDNKTPIRKFTMRLGGRAVGGSAERSVELLRVRLEQAPPFGALSESVTVPQFEADKARGAEKTDRVFTILLVYNGAPFE